MLHFLSLLAPLHVDPAVSDPAHISAIPDDEVSEGEGRPQFSQDDLQQDGNWHGLYKDVGLFTEHEWNLLMCKCLASMGTFRIEHNWTLRLTGHGPRNTPSRCWFFDHRSPS